jgi:cystathionine gamma-synthase
MCNSPELGADAPGIAVLGGISASAEPTAWWSNQIGEGLAIDPARCRVVGIDWIVRDDRPTTTHDQADALNAELDRLGLDCLDAIVGASYGGMVALAFAQRFPQRVRRLVILSAAHQSHPMATAHRVIQRRILALGGANGHAREALALARALAITTYRTRDEFQQRFAVAPRTVSPPRFDVEDYLDHCGSTFAGDWTADRYHALSESLDLHQVDPGSITTPAFLLAVEGDTLVPPSQMRDLQQRLAGPVELTVIASSYGHDAFLKEEQKVRVFLDAALVNHVAWRADPASAHDDATAVARKRAVRSCSGASEGAEAGAAPAHRTTIAKSTIAVRAGIGTDLHHRAVVPPIHLSSTFEFDGLGGKGRYDYTRSGNPTRDQLGAALAQLEGGVGGIITSTGMSAVSLALQLLRPGDRILAPHDCYGGTHRVLTALARRGQFALQVADLSAPDAEAVVRGSGARLLWIETPSNPLLRITDIRRLAAVAHQFGALVVVDNTFLSPALQRPIELGADIVVHSTTKYLNGHSDVVGGAVVAADPAVQEELAWWANCLGITGAPFDSYLTLRGLRTLAVRMRAHLENAERLAALLENHSQVSRVHYPGLASHPGHHLAARQQNGFGAMISFELDGGLPAVEQVVKRLRHFSLAESLGGVESLIAHPATMTHASMDDAARAKAGITDALLRISVGIEDGGDLAADLAAALVVRR